MSLTQRFCSKSVITRANTISKFMNSKCRLPARYFQACKDAEFIGKKTYKQPPSLVHVPTSLLVLTNSVTYFTLHFRFLSAFIAWLK